MVSAMLFVPASQSKSTKEGITIGAGRQFLLPIVGEAGGWVAVQFLMLLSVHVYIYMYSQCSSYNTKGFSYGHFSPRIPPTGQYLVCKWRIDH